MCIRDRTDAVGTLVFHSELTENAEAAKIAEEFHVSLGRADCILTAANKTGLPTDEVARMSLDELLKFQEASGIASVSVSKFISLEEAKKIALKDAKLDELAVSYTHLWWLPSAWPRTHGRGRLPSGNI